MSNIVEGTLLWEPSREVIEHSNLTHYMTWLRENKSLEFPDYAELWQWSVTEIEAFWATVWDYFSIQASAPYSTVLAERKMPGAKWFPGVKLNYAENLFCQITDERPAIITADETGTLTEMSWRELHDRTARFAQVLKAYSVQPGDRVVGYLPHIPETVIAFLATASLGAIWSCCSPEFGVRSVLDRFQQIDPKVLVAGDAYSWNGKIQNRLDIVAELQAQLPTLERTILVQSGLATEERNLSDVVTWEEAQAVARTETLQYEQVPFEHPLWILYSSGTTGPPKAIVQGHGGIVLEHRKTTALHLDLHPNDRFFWHTSTGWMMWNLLIGGLLNGNTVVCYNGSPAYPDLNRLWRLAEEIPISYFGTSASWITACMKAGLRPNSNFDLSRIRAVGSTGSPLSVPGFAWVYENVGDDLALQSYSGGTDLCTGFVGGVTTLPVRAGELQHASLGANVQSFDEQAQPVTNKVGELVITEPMPSMPVCFWNDPDGERYRTSYFDMFPGVWRHGDWIKINDRGGCIISGRSDSTINRQGVRMGTSEIYQSVESLDDVADSLLVDLELLGQESYMPLFVVLRDGVTLDDQLKRRINGRIRSDISPRHVPSEIFAIDEVPYTLSGKKMEVPIRKILLGRTVETAANLGAMRNPESLEFFVRLAEQLRITDN